MLVVFLIVPADFSASGSTEKTIKFLGLCVLGGYAGPALLEKIIKETLKDIRKEQVEIKAKIEHQEVISAQLERKRERDELAILLVDAYLNDTEDQQIGPARVHEAVSDASPSARFDIYQRTRNIRRKSWRTDRAAVGRTVVVFEALTAAGWPDRERHRLLAQLAYALKDRDRAGTVTGKLACVVAAGSVRRCSQSRTPVTNFRRA
ncbi:hypothetical protein DF3PB_2690004 [uncultured Defluviicoccus sp.]|uniref:Uncharacterized protein n=1 Tax=metagenome TaxID=256318 RepID=A0A380TDG1_9ZZZZ|nr:hypothetical protein DF3PB_2690004 [uncultured Defluviicoccus sp.]